MNLEELTKGPSESEDEVSQVEKIMEQVNDQPVEV